jgi:hypothetical protein
MLLLLTTPTTPAIYGSAHGRVQPVHLVSGPPEEGNHTTTTTTTTTTTNTTTTTSTTPPPPHQQQPHNPTPAVDGLLRLELRAGQVAHDLRAVRGAGAGGDGAGRGIRCQC